mgnify:CR=1 FL=1
MISSWTIRQLFKLFYTSLLNIHEALIISLILRNYFTTNLDGFLSKLKKIVLHSNRWFSIKTQENRLTFKSIISLKLMKLSYIQLNNILSQYEYYFQLLLLHIIYYQCTGGCRGKLYYTLIYRWYSNRNDVNQSLC